MYAAAAPAGRNSAAAAALLRATAAATALALALQLDCAAGASGAGGCAPLGLAALNALLQRAHDATAPLLGGAPLLSVECFGACDAWPLRAALAAAGAALAALLPRGRPLWGFAAAAGALAATAFDAGAWLAAAPPLLLLLAAAAGEYACASRARSATRRPLRLGIVVVAAEPDSGRCVPGLVLDVATDAVFALEGARAARQLAAAKAAPPWRVVVPHVTLLRPLHGAPPACAAATSAAQQAAAAGFDGVWLELRDAGLGDAVTHAFEPATGRVARVEAPAAEPRAARDVPPALARRLVFGALASYNACGGLCLIDGGGGGGDGGEAAVAVGPARLSLQRLLESGALPEWQRAVAARAGAGWGDSRLRAA